MSQVVVVPQRNVAMERPELGMRCDDGEMPHPLEGRADDYFIGLGQLTTAEGKFVGSVAAAFYKGTLALILAPMDEAQPAYWLSAPTSSLTVTTEGSTGLFKKRPLFVNVQGDTFGVEIGEIAAFFPHRRAAQSGRSAQFVAALGKG